jgi:hypothetical protein
MAHVIGLNSNKGSDLEDFRFDDAVGVVLSGGYISAIITALYGLVLPLTFIHREQSARRKRLYISKGYKVIATVVADKLYP